jgi:hypothetical protein
MATWMRYVICIGTITDDMKSPNYNFEKSGFETSFFLYNMADTITLVMMIFMVVPLVSIITSLLPKSLLFTNADNFIRGRFLIAIVNITYLKTAFAVGLNFF